MKFEIELDPNKIDYEAINKILQEKIKNLTPEELSMDERLNIAVSNQVGNYTAEYFSKTSWGILNNNTKSEIREILVSHVKEYVQPHVSEILDQIPKETLDEIIISTIAPVMMICIKEFSEGVLNMATNNQYAINESIVNRKIYEIFNK